MVVMNKENLENRLNYSISDTNTVNSITTATVERIFLDIKESPFGHNFINGRSVDEVSGEPDVFLVDLRDYSISLAANLLGQKVTLEKRKNGFKLRPIKLQPQETIDFLNQLNDKEALNLNKGLEQNNRDLGDKSDEVKQRKIENNISESEEFVENLIITFSEQSHKLGLPMALAVCIPNLQFKK